MAAKPGRMQKGFADLTRSMSLLMPTLVNVQSNLTWAASQIAYARRKRGKR